MPEIYKIATLNINGMVTPPRIAMLEDFLQKHEIDIILLQKVTRPIFDDIRSFAAYTTEALRGEGRRSWHETIFSLRTQYVSLLAGEWPQISKV